MLVDEQRVLLDLQVLLQALAVAQEVLQGLVGLVQLVLQHLDALGDLGHLLDQLVVRLVVAGLHVRAAGPLLEAGLGHAQWRVLGGDIALEPLNVPLLFGDFLET